MSRMPNETSRSYALYKVYRDMGPARSYQKLTDYMQTDEFRETYGMRPVKLGAIEHKAAKWKWQDRIRKWDREIAETERRERDAAIKKAAERHAKMAKLFQTKADAALQKLKPSELNPKEILDFGKEGIKLERMILGEPTEITQNEFGASAQALQERITINIIEDKDGPASLAGPEDDDDEEDETT